MEGEHVPARWAADPYRRHRYRYWDGARWTGHVTDDDLPPARAPRAAPDTVLAADLTPDTVLAADLTPDTMLAADLTPDDAPPAPAPAPAAPPARGNLLVLPLPWRTHAALTIVSLGLWLLALPALELWRRQRREPAVVAALAAVVLVVLGAGGIALESGGPRGVVVLPDVAVGAPASTATTGTIAPGPLTPSTTRSATPPPPSTTRRRSTGSRTPRVTTSPRRSTTRPARTTSPTASARPSASPATPTSRGPRTTLDPRFLTCVQAKAAGFGPYRRGVDPEYWWYLDVDGDGVVCG